MKSHNFHNIPAELKASQQELVEFIISRVTYNSETGKIFYKPRVFANPSPRNKQWNTRFANAEAGFLSEGYIRVALSSKIRLYAHQIAFACMKGYIPVEVDHEDKNKTNNKWINLRDADRTKNSANTFKRKTNQSGYKGVSWSKWKKQWRMDIQHLKIQYYSFHDTKEEAYLAYCKKSAELHGEFGCVE